MTYQSTVRRVTLVAAILVAIASALFLVALFGKGVPLAQASADNTPATGAPTIIGTAQVGETLTADTTGIADADGLTNVAYNYQWLADDTDIAGATGGTYVINPWVVDTFIKVRVSFADDARNPETRTSAATSAVEPVPNIAPTGFLIIGGMPEVGQNLWSSRPRISDGNGLRYASFSYQWVRSDGTTDVDILGASSTTYWLEDADEGKTIKVRVSYRDDGGNSETVSSIATTTVAARPDTSELSAPTGLSSKRSQDGRGIDVNWDAPEGTVTGYQILRLELPYGWGWVEPHPYGCNNFYVIHVNDTGSDATTYTDADVYDGATYAYRVRAINSDGVGLTSSITSLQYRPDAWWPKGPPGSPLLAPTDIESTSINGGIGLTWDAATDITTLLPFLQIGEVTGYQILRRRPEHCEFGYSRVHVANTGTTVTRWADRDVVPGTLYEYHIRAINDVGAGFLDPRIATGIRLEALTVSDEPNTAPTGAPTITGTAQVGETLTADGSGIGDADGLYWAKFDYQWLGSRDTEIQGATNATYTLVADDEGKTIKVRVSFTDDRGNNETLTSAATPAVEASTNNPATGAPTISGTAQVGETLTANRSGIADADGISNVQYEYQWLADDADISGATNATYTLVVEDEGKAIKVEVTFTDDAGNAETLTSEATDAVKVATTTPKAYITVVIAAGDDTVSWSDPDECTSDYNTYLKVTSGPGTGTTSRTHIGSVASGSTEATQTISFSWTGNSLNPPSVKVELYCGTFDASSSQNVLIASTGLAMWRSSLREGTYSSAPLTALSISSGTLSPAFDRGISEYTAEVPNDIEVITLDPTVLTGYQTDFVRNPIWGVVAGCGSGCNYGYGNGTTTGIVLADDDEETEGFQINLNRGENRLGIGVNKGNNVAAGPGQLYYLTVTVENSPATGLPTISGTAQVGETLTADTSGIADAYGLTNATFTYQWLGSRDTEIQGATNATYTLVADDEGKTIKVRVSFTDDRGNNETLTSAATPAVEASTNNPATGAPTISGMTQVGQTLTADITGIADADGVSGETFTYQWISSDGTVDTDITDIERATGSTFTLVAADQGKSVKVRVTFTDDAGHEETLTSAPAGPVFSDGLPGAPRNLTATAGNKEITLSWESPADNGNAPATRYRIEWRVDGKDYDQNHWGTARSPTYTTNDQANLANGVKYFFRVKAENDDGNSYGPYGPASEEVSATPTSGSAVDLGTPVLSDAKTLHHGMVQLDWEDIEDAGWYVVQYYHVEDGEWLDLPAEGVDIAFHGSSAVVSNLHGLSWLRVGAASCDGASEWSQIEQWFGTNASDWEGVPVPEVAEGDEIAPCPVVLGTPVLSDTETLHHGMVQLDWQDIEDAGWYVVQYYHLEGGEWLDLPAEGVDIAFHGSGAVVSNLHGLSWLRVRAMSCAGASEWSQIEQLFGTNASDWEGVPVPEVAEGDEFEPCDEDTDTPENSPATGAPTISGTAQVGETLTANTSGVADADGLGNVQYEYQWLADDSEIVGATSLTYTLADTDEGKAIKVEVTFIDDAGNDETLTSGATDAVAAKPTPNSPATGAPSITGTAQVGETLMANTSGISDENGLSNVQYEYQWLADDADISGATNATYTLVAADEGQAIKVRVSFTDDAGNEESLTSAGTEAVAAAPTPNNPATKAYITVVIASGDDTVSWSDPGGCSSDYNIYKAITPSDNYSETSHIHLVSAAPGSTQATLDISHSEDDRYPAVEVELYCGTYDAASSQNLLISSTQLSMGINIREGTYSSAPLTALTISSGMLSPDFDRGPGRYSAEVPSDVEVITLDPTVLTGYQTDFVKNPGLYTVSFCPSPRSLNCVYFYGDGTTTGIVLSDADTDTEGFQINLDPGENRLSIGVHKGPVAAGSAKTYPLTITRAANTPATGQPTINGTAQVGEVLEVDTSGIADADGLANVTFSYQWLSSRDTEIGGATSSTYTLQASDEGKAVKVQVSFTDDAGNAETLTSAATDPVAAADAANSPATGAPTISGTARVGETLTADTSGIADADGLGNVQYDYQWLADGRRNLGRYQLHLYGGSSGRRQGHQSRSQFHGRRGQRGDADQRGDGRCGGCGTLGAAVQAQGPRSHSNPRLGDPHLERPPGREHHRLRDSAPRPRQRPRGRLQRVGGGHGHGGADLHRHHRRGQHHLHLPDQGHQRARNERAFPLGPHRHPGASRTRQAHGPLGHGDPQPGGPHLGRPWRREHHRLRDPTPPSRGRPGGPVR